MASEPFVNQMRRGNAHVKASRKTFKNIYSRFHTFHRMGASQELEAFFKKLRSGSRNFTNQSTGKIVDKVEEKM